MYINALADVFSFTFNDISHIILLLIFSFPFVLNLALCLLKIKKKMFTNLIKVFITI